MGSGIAQVAAQSGFDVWVQDSFQGAIERAQSGIEKSLLKLSEKKLITETPSEILKRIHFVKLVKDIPSADLAVEAVTENVDIKLALFKELDEHFGASTILASNTSSISISMIGAVTKRPAQVIGMHFMNPVPLMKLVEIIRSPATSDATYKVVQETAIKMGKTTVLSKDAPGFIVNRILMPMINEAAIAFGDGIGSAEDIDVGMKLGTNQPMGPLALADLIGLDTCLSIMQVLHTGFASDKYKPASILVEYVTAGRLGKKTKNGFYKYE